MNMKKYLFAILCVVFASCAEDDRLASDTSRRDAKIIASAPDFFDADASRTSLTPTNKGMSFSWVAGDKLAVYGPSGETFTNFKIDPNGEGTTPNTAVFCNEDFRLAKDSVYSCVYPCDYNSTVGAYTVYEATRYPVSFTGQEQSANESAEHLSAYDYLVASGTANALNSCDFQFKHLCAVIRVKITCENLGTVKTLKVKSNGTPFVTAGYVDMTSATQTITPTATSNTITLSLGANDAGIAITPDNKTLTAYLITPAIDLSGTTLDFSLVANDVVCSYKNVAGKNLKAGGASAFSFNLKTPPTSDECVNLGLPSGTLWATTNIGANNPEDDGRYFQWADTQGYTSDVLDGKVFFWNQYKYCDGAWDKQTKYCTNALFGTVDSKYSMELVDDAAYIVKGFDWCVPSYYQFQELVDPAYTTTEWTTLNGYYGLKVTSKSNSNYIFLPAAGSRTNSVLTETGTKGYYWTRTLNGSVPINARSFTFNETDDPNTESNNARCDGLTIRPVWRWTKTNEFSGDVTF